MELALLDCVGSGDCKVVKFNLPETLMKPSPFDIPLRGKKKIVCSQALLWLLHLHRLRSPSSSWSSIAEERGSEGKADLANPSLSLLPQKCSDAVVCVVPGLMEVPEQDWLGWELHSNTCQCCTAEPLHPALHYQTWGLEGAWWLLERCK